jgi:enamidase
MKTAIINIGGILTGDINNPFIDKSTILIENGRISAIGEDVDFKEVDRVIDANGVMVAPGLIDSHCHVTIGEYTPRTKTIDYFEGMLNGGVTAVISAGEAHVPGRPTDPQGAKALAITAAKIYKNFRPAGVKVLGGAVILQLGLTEDDFKEMSKEGVRIVGEIGMGTAKKPEQVIPMVKWAKKYGMIVQMHIGGASFLCDPVTAEDVLQINPDVASHINGGCTALPLREIDKIIDEFKGVLEIVENGNPKVALYVVNALKSKNELHRIIIGTDTPSGYGVSFRGVFRTICLLSSIGGVKPEEAVAMATGNTMNVYKLDYGKIEVGRVADFIGIDAPVGAGENNALESIEAGNVPGIAMIILDGELKSTWGTNTEPPKRKIKVLK